ncbi:TAP42-like protein [Emericellopsis atlantica]|uniref:TAP42-like protein n=1 Tax=Emericellopsis atlantica TaxID=2614577 RepID=A0A9P8CTY1_9HYPO|nr:TAP42-like protein [Emericellopsis atlantica]KAG9259243.1 TAP42-like protein [Emericellopsis atlantica]
MDPLDTPQTLSSLLEATEKQRTDLESRADATSAAYAADVESTIALHQQLLETLAAASVFSVNETLDDVATSELPYMLTAYHMAELMERAPGHNKPSERVQHLKKTKRIYDLFLNLVESYGLVEPPYNKLLDRYREEDDEFGVVPRGMDMSAKRNTKIAAFKAEKQLKTKLEALRKNPRYLQNGDEEVIREVYLTNVAYRLHKTFHALDSINREIDMLKAVPDQPEQRLKEIEERDDDTRLDGPMRMKPGTGGPLLSKAGKPLQPFTLLGANARGERTKGVFRSGHNLPTMTIDEYLEEERRQGNIIEGGEEPKKVIDEDDYEAMEREMYKARDWDEFKDNNPKGSGNTMNMG